eukprot:TRINITY_DN6330_c0_g1_i1.p1 TRINITY_DN6330_c0_g1~~TRINITY_DN6330_c0_g1_i1.p1  ORF type:complete len:268 (+),score=82.75 TRINITY_DN6330_c0_g1_i1:54-857(+)
MPSIRLLVKNPAAHIADFEVEREIQSTIGDLKQFLQETYPNNPEVSRQKLIHSGKLLQNEMTLYDVFKLNDTTLPQTIHIVVSKSAPQPQQPLQMNNPPPVFAPNLNPNEQILRQQILQQQLFQHQQMAAQHFQQYQQQFQNNNNNRPQFQPQPEQRERQHRGESPLWLILKISFMVYMLSRGGSMWRVFFLSLAGFIIYLYQTGLFTFSAQVHVDGPNNNVDAPIGQRGIMTELVYPFFYSLIPTWQPPVEQHVPNVDLNVPQVIN